MPEEGQPIILFHILGFHVDVVTPEFPKTCSDPAALLCFVKCLISLDIAFQKAET